MGQHTLVSDAGEVVLHQVRAVEPTRLVMVLRSAGKESRCPACSQTSRPVHSRYFRQLHHLPWEGIPVSIELCVRRFFCCAEKCGRRIFTERLQNTVKRYGRRTCRLSTALEQITLALVGICWIPLGAATGHPGQRLNTPASVAPQGSDAFGLCASDIGHRRLGVA
jgi:hypothetical protein